MNPLEKALAMADAIVDQDIELTSPWLAAARKAVATGGFQEVDGVVLDLYSASAMMQIFNALALRNQVKLAALPVEQAHDLVFKLIAKTGA